MSNSPGIDTARQHSICIASRGEVKSAHVGNVIAYLAYNCFALDAEYVQIVT